MNAVPLMIATLCYVWTAAQLYVQGSVAMAGVFLFYACANLCLLWLAYGGR